MCFAQVFERFHDLHLSQPQMAREHDLLDEGSRAGNFGLMLVDESFPGVRLFMAA